MTNRNTLLGLLIASALISPAAFANDVQGEIEELDQNEQTVKVQGITLQVTESTRFDDGLNSFADLQQGQRVEVDFTYRDGRHYATEIEKDN